jgi:hypothetical protein
MTATATRVHDVPALKDNAPYDPTGVRWHEGGPGMRFEVRPPNEGIVARGFAIERVSEEGERVAPAGVILLLDNQARGKATATIRAGKLPPRGEGSGVAEHYALRAMIGDLTITVPSRGCVAVGPLDPSRFAQPDKTLLVDAEVSVKVAAVRLASTVTIP